MTTKRTLAANSPQVNCAWQSVSLFIAGRDRFSAITLGGAADVIISRLLLHSGQENFTDSIIRMETESGDLSERERKAGEAINNMLFINALKHFDRGDDGIVEVLDLEECALAAILKAMANYVALCGKKDD